MWSLFHKIWRKNSKNYKRIIMRKYILSIIVLFSLLSCEKNAGEGGTSVIDSTASKHPAIVVLKTINTTHVD